MKLGASRRMSTSGLAKAGPRQDITFSTIGSHSRVLGSSIKDPTVNAGRVFYQGGKLNVIFGELQSNYRKKNVYGQRDQDFTPRRQGTREKASKQKVALTAVPGVALHRQRRRRNDWLTIDLAVAGAQAVATSPSSRVRALRAPRPPQRRRNPHHRPPGRSAAPAAAGPSAERLRPHLLRRPRHRQPTPSPPKSSAACGR